MEFLTPGEKIKKIRKQLGMIQQDLEDVNLKRNFVSMIENGERNPSRETARIIAEKFNNKAAQKGMSLSIDEDYILSSPKEQAAEYCTNKLQLASDLRDFDEIITISEKYLLEKHQLEAYVKMGDIYFERKRFCDSFIHYIRALDLCKNLKNNAMQCIIYNKLGMSKLNEGDYIEGLEYFNKAYNYSKMVNDTNTKLQAIYNVILTYRKLERHERVIEYADMYINNSNDTDNFKQRMLAKLVKADALIYKKNFAEANEVLTKMLVEHKDSKEFFGYIYNALGNIYLYKMEYSDAAKYYNIAQEMVEKYDDNHIHANLIDRAYLYTETGEWEESVKLLSRGIDLAEEYNDNEYLSIGFKVVVALYNTGKCFEIVKNMFVRYLDIIDKYRLNIDKREIYCRLSLMHLNQNEYETSKEYLRLSLV